MAENYERKIYDAINRGYVSGPDELQGGTSPEITGESIFPKPSPLPKKQTGATGATGPPKPAPAAQSSAARALFQQQQQADASGKTWAETAANHAKIVQESFERPSSILAPPQGMTLREMLQAGNAQGYDTVKNPNGGYNWIPTPPARTTADNQRDLLNNAQAPGAGGGVLPGWNSPTGQNIDLTANGPRSVDTSAAGPTPPSGWLNNAIAASRSGANTYYTGGSKAGGSAPQAEVNPSFAATPSGGSVNIPNNNDNPFTGDRANLLQAINQSQKTADQYQGGY